jgi:hypothetical protein
VNFVRAKGLAAIPITSRNLEGAFANNKLLLAVPMANLGIFRISLTYLQYKLHLSVILDFSAIVYIRNNPTCFIELSLAINSSFLYTREDYILIVKYSTTELVVQT